MKQAGLTARQRAQRLILPAYDAPRTDGRNNGYDGPSL